MNPTSPMALAAFAAVTACSPQPQEGQLPADQDAISNLPVTIPTDVANATTPVPTDAWIGKWTGVEGLALDIKPAGGPGEYRLHIALLDGANDYSGVADGEVIRFERNGKQETIRKVSGAETGLKWLAEKQNCLMIQPGEGFCRD